MASLTRALSETPSKGSTAHFRDCTLGLMPSLQACPPARGGQTRRHCPRPGTVGAASRVLGRGKMPPGPRPRWVRDGPPLRRSGSAHRQWRTSRRSSPRGLGEGDWILQRVSCDERSGCLRGDHQVGSSRLQGSSEHSDAHRLPAPWTSSTPSLPAAPVRLRSR